MKFTLISRHTGGKKPSSDETEQLMKDLGDWLATLKNPLAIPIRSGRSVTADKIEDYVGEVGGVILFEADSLDQAAKQAQKSPGLKYGWTHDVFPEITMEDAAQQ
ncbi:MAG: YciI family protein [Steroidobacter sp.]